MSKDPGVCGTCHEEKVRAKYRQPRFDSDEVTISTGSLGVTSKFAKNAAHPYEYDNDSHCTNINCEDGRKNIVEKTKDINKGLGHAARTGDWTKINEEDLERLSQISENATEVVDVVDIDWLDDDKTSEWQETNNEIDEFEQNTAGAIERTKEVARASDAKVHGNERGDECISIRDNLDEVRHSIYVHEVVVDDVHRIVERETEHEVVVEEGTVLTENEEDEQQDSDHPSTTPEETDTTTIRAVSDDDIGMAFGEEGITLTYGGSQPDSDSTTVQVSADETIDFGDSEGTTTKTLLLDDADSNATIHASAADTIGTAFDGSEFHMDFGDDDLYVSSVGDEFNTERETNGSVTLNLGDGHTPAITDNHERDTDPDTPDQSPDQSTATNTDGQPADDTSVAEDTGDQPVETTTGQETTPDGRDIAPEGPSPDNPEGRPSPTSNGTPTTEASTNGQPDAPDEPAVTNDEGEQATDGPGPDDQDSELDPANDITGLSEDTEPSTNGESVGQNDTELDPDNHISGLGEDHDAETDLGNITGVDYAADREESTERTDNNDRDRSDDDSPGGGRR